MSEGTSPRPPRKGTNSSSSRLEILTPHHSFGINKRVSEPFVYLDPDHLLFCVGRRLVVAEINGKETNFLPEHESKLKRICSIAVSSNKKWLAISEVTDSGSQISIINLTSLKRVGVLKTNEGREVRGMSFSSDGRYLACFTCASLVLSPSSSYREEKVGTNFPPFGTSTFQNTQNLTTNQNQKAPNDAISYEAVVFYWNVEKQVLNSTAKLNENIVSVSISPFSSSQILVYGRRNLRVFRADEGNLKVSVPAKKDTQYNNYTSAIWLADNVFTAATDTGSFQVFYDMELKRTYTNLFETQCHAKVIKPTVQGFIVGDNYSTLYIFEKNVDIANMKLGPNENSNAEFFKLISTLDTKSLSSIIHIAPSPDETRVFCLFDNNSLISYSLANRESNNFSSSIEEQPQITEVVSRIPQISSSLHYHLGSILSMDVCERRPMIVTCGSDQTIRVWNYNDKSQELMKSLTEEAVSLAIHPMGSQLAVAFQSKIRFFAITFGDLLEETSVAVKAKEMLYSHGGHLLAVIANNTIQIYSPFTFEMIHSLKGHVGNVKAISWSQDDKRLVSAGIDGTIYQWSIIDGSRLDEHVCKGVQYAASVFVHGTHSTLVVGNDGFLRHIGFSPSSNLTSMVLSEIATGTDRIVSMVFVSTQSPNSPTSGYVFCGTSSGTLRVLEFPLVGYETRDYQIHNGPITSLRVSGDQLFTSGEDGSVFVFKIALSNINTPSLLPDMVLVTKQTIEHQQGVVQELESKYKELLSRTDYSEGLIKKQYEDVLAIQRKESEIRHQQELERFDELQKASMTQEISFRESLLSKEKDFSKSSEEIEKIYERKLKDVMERQEEIRMAKEDAQYAAEEQMRALQHKHSLALKELKESYDLKLKEEKEKTERQIRENEMLKSQYNEELDQQEEEYEFALADAKEKADKSLQVERDGTMSMKGESILWKRRVEMSLVEHNLQNALLTDKDKEILRVKKKIQEFEEIIDGLRKEVDERNQTINNKETRILELKQKNQELEKYKFVLDFKINELKDELNPKEIMMTDMKTQIRDMDDELQRTLRGNDQWEIMFHERTSKIDSLQKEGKDLKLQVQEKEKFISLFVEDLHKLYAETDSSQWKGGLKHLYQTYVTQDNKRRITKEDQERMKELARQRQHMEHSLNYLKEQATRGESRLRSDVHRKVTENASLIGDLNDLRRENWELKSKILVLETQSKVGNHGGIRSPPSSSRNLYQNEEDPSRMKTPTSPTQSPMRPVDLFTAKEIPILLVQNTPEDRLRMGTPKLTSKLPFPNLKQKSSNTSPTRSLSSIT